MPEDVSLKWWEIPPIADKMPPWEITHQLHSLGEIDRPLRVACQVTTHPPWRSELTTDLDDLKFSAAYFAGYAEGRGFHAREIEIWLEDDTPLTSTD
jgi:hypothetical protein